MNKSVFIAEKPSVAQEFAKALKVKTTRHDGYLESENTIVTWCVGHLVTMSYPEVYDIKYKRWTWMNGKWIVQHLHQSTPDLKQSGRSPGIHLAKHLLKHRTEQMRHPFFPITVICGPVNEFT